MPRLKLFLLGSPLVELDGRPVEPDTRKAVAFLAYLAVEAQAYSRETLAALFWPEYDSQRAYHNLRRTLWSINKALGKGWLEADQDTVALRNRSELWIDAQAFRLNLETYAARRRDHRHAGDELCTDCMQALKEAVEQYRDDFMAGFTLPDSPGFDDWQFFQRESLRQDFARALERLVEACARAGSFEAGIGYARRWLALDPLHEPALRALMRLYALAGQRSAALRQYESGVQILQRELGVDPQPETTALYEQIRTDTGFAAGTPSQPPASPAPPSNLPHQITPFIGRQKELEDLQRLLVDPSGRLLTLLGPGGIGKTRLALEAARQAGETGSEFRDGVYFVPLAPVNTAEHILPALAKALDFAYYSKGNDLAQQLFSFLRGKRMLLVLDNYEHLLDGETARLLPGDILTAAGGVKMLVTSRASLNVRGEQIYPLTGMPFPETGRNWLDLRELGEYSSVQLFIQSARRVDPRFELNPADLPLVVRICQLVQGIPLGLELAAAWVELLPLAEIAAEIERSLDFLETEMHDVPERQRSLRAVFSATWNRLDEEARAVFKQLSVFRGGFTRRAAQEVAGATLRGLATLAGHALLYRRPLDRYEIHELLRQYAEEELRKDRPAWQAARDRHSEVYTRFASERGREMNGPGHRAALEALDNEIENVRAAWDWSVETGQFERPDSALYSYYTYLLARGLYPELYRELSETVEALIGAEQAAPHQLLLAKCLILLAIIDPDTVTGGPGRQLERSLSLVRALQAERRLGRWYIMLAAEYGWRLDPQAGLEMLEQSMEWVRQDVERQDVEREYGDEKDLALILQSRAGLLYKMGEYGQAKEAITAAISLCLKTGDSLSLADNYRILGDLLNQERDYAGAKQVFTKRLEIYQALDDRTDSGYALFHLGLFALGAGEYPEAVEAFRQVREIFTRLGSTVMLASGLSWESIAMLRMGDYPRARALRLESLAVSQEIGELTGALWSLYELGEIERVMGNFAAAEEKYEECARKTQDQKMSQVFAFIHKGMGDLALARGELDAAQAHFQESIALGQRDYNFWCAAYATYGLGRVALARRETAQAEAHFRDALVQAEKIGDRTLILVPLSGFAELLMAQGELERSAALAASICQHPATWQEIRDRLAGLLASCAAQLPAHAFEAAQAQTVRADLDRLVAEFGHPEQAD